MSRKIETSIEVAEQALKCLVIDLEQDGRNDYASVVRGYIDAIGGIGVIIRVSEERSGDKP